LFYKKEYDLVFEENKMKKGILAVFIAVMMFAIVFSGCFEEKNNENKQESTETLTAEDNAAIEWIENNLNKENSVIASDHRLERMIESRGFNTTNDEVYNLWASENISECTNELYGLGDNYSFNNITHVLIDDIMLNHVVHMGFKVEAINMTYESYYKFSPPIFKLVYESKTEEIDSITNEPVHWARVFQVNWSYYQSYLACGCGCCVGTEPLVMCLYHSKGDDIQKIIDENQELAQSPGCAMAGCSLGTKYIYCD
jgi:hypothetical protein